MDPDATLKIALDALCNTPGPACTVEDLEAARDALADLAERIERGEYLPRWPFDGPTVEDVITATADSAKLVAQMTRVCWALDAIDDDTTASRRRVVLAVNALRFTCGSVAQTLGHVERLTDSRILRLRAEAAIAGDGEQVAICDAAIAGDLVARGGCARVIDAARAMDDS